ncbi:MAG: CoA ester lyase [Desulfurococcales archaeon]|jgi:citrate lyase subunit beta/citryl-CoA lyase|nr:CoA ester lyase [Desulfurococcales archaeon]
MGIELPRRSMLFVPGIDERKIRKSAELAADSVILDLEDSVPPGDKERARELISKLLPELEWRRELCVRINTLYSIDGILDIVHVSKWDKVTCIVIPKAEGDLGFIYKATGRNIVPLIETARGFSRIEDIARSEGVVAITWGPADLALSVGGEVSAYENNIYIRSLIAITASAYGIDAIDKVYFKIEDLEGFRRDALEAKKLGYVGKTVIHPTQIEISNEIFTPSREEIEWARKVIELFEQASRMGKGATRMGGQMIDAVHYRIARKILERVPEDLKR